MMPHSFYSESLPDPVYNEPLKLAHLQKVVKDVGAKYQSIHESSRGFFRKFFPLSDKDRFLLARCEELLINTLERPLAEEELSEDERCLYDSLVGRAHELSSHIAPLVLPEHRKAAYLIHPLVIRQQAFPSLPCEPLKVKSSQNRT